MRRRAVPALFALAIFLLACAGCAGSDGSKGSVPRENLPKADNGMIDLNGWRWADDGVVPLNGVWSFGWLATLPSKMRIDTTIQVPGTWGSTVAGNGMKLSDRGYAVYGLKIRHAVSGDMLAIRVPNVSTAYQLYIDGKLTLSRGEIGLDGRHSMPFQLPGTAYFEANDQETELLLIVSNFDHRRGGIRTELVLGKANQIQKLEIRHAAQELIVFGCLLMIGFHHLGLFVLRRKEYANLYFALLCLLVALRMGLIGEGFIVQWLPWIDWEIATRVEYVSFVFAGWAGFGYYLRMYPKELSALWFKVATASGILLAAGAALLPSIVFTSWLIVFQAYILLVSFAILFGLLPAAFRKRTGAKLAIVGVAGFLLTIVNDMLFYNGWRTSIDLVPFGMLFLVAMNAFIISLRFSQTYDRAETMSAELTEWNNTLENRIGERTEELHRSYTTLEEAKTELERMEASRRQLVSNISHDLRTPITLLKGYLEALRDDVIAEKEQRDATVRLMLTKVEGLNSLIQDLFELSVLEARKVELMKEEMTLRTWAERLCDQYGMELKQKGIRFSCEAQEDETGEATVFVDVHRMNRVFANLIYNAVRYTPQGGSIDISMSADFGDKEALVVVKDSGDGIHPEDLPFLFDRYYKKDKSRHSASGGNGLGLAITKEIVETHGGTIRARIVPEGGGCFEIRLPLADPGG